MTLESAPVPTPAGFSLDAPQDALFGMFGVFSSRPSHGSRDRRSRTGVADA